MTPPKEGTCLKVLGSLGPKTSNNIDLKNAGLSSVKSDVPETAFQTCGFNISGTPFLIRHRSLLELSALEVDSSPFNIGSQALYLSSCICFPGNDSSYNSSRNP